MKKESREVNKHPNREKYVANFAITSWLEERYKKVLESGNVGRINKYKGIAPAKLLVEEPTIFNREKGYFQSTIIARSNGLLFPDPKITFPTFEEFLIHIDPDKKLYDKPGIPTSLTLDSINAIATETEKFPEIPEYAVTKIKDTEKYALLVYSQSMLLDLDHILDVVFDGYMFQEIKGFSLEKYDKGYPKKQQQSLDGYMTGSVTISEVLLAEQSVTIEILNINLIKKLANIREYLYNGDFLYNGEITYSNPK